MPTQKGNFYLDPNSTKKDIHVLENAISIDSYNSLVLKRLNNILSKNIIKKS
jgi:hypothetical protein